MRLAPIPLSLRPSEMQVYAPATGGFGGGFEKEPKTIKHVRYDKASLTSFGGYVFQDGSCGLIFVDATSEGAFEVVAGSKIVIDGEQLTCVKCTPCVAFGNDVHHWEIEVK